MSEAGEDGSWIESPGFARHNGATALQGLLHQVLRETVERLEAVVCAVYFAEEGGAALGAVMLGGASPALLSVPERIPLDYSYTSAKAFQTERTVVADGPRLDRNEDDLVALLGAYAVSSAPITDGDRRMGVLTVVTVPVAEDARTAQRTWLGGRARRLATDLAPLAQQGASLTPPPRPAVVLLAGADQESRVSADMGWGLPDVAGSAGLSLMYQIRRLDRSLSRALTREEVAEAARTHLMVPFDAQEMTLTTKGDGRLWVVGHSGPPAATVGKLQGSGLNESNPTADALRGQPTFLRDRAEKRARYPDLPDDEWASWAYLPLKGDRENIGVCGLGFRRSRELPARERSVMMMMAARIGAALERVSQRENESSLAGSLQKRLLPSTLSDLPEAVVTARYLPAASTASAGGDWYDVVKLAEDRIALIVGDVEGHSVESSVVMGQVRASVLAYASEGHRPRAIMERASKLLTELDTELLATCCVVFLDGTAGTVTCCLAGHPPPVRRGPDGRTEPLDAQPGVPLGVQSSRPYQDFESDLLPGSLLLLYTNGLAGGGLFDAVAYAEEQLSSLGQNAPRNLEEKADQLVAALPGAARTDDAVLLLARYEGARLSASRRLGRMRIQRRDLQGVATARRFVRAQLTSWDRGEVASPLELIVSELATNALVHADSDVELRLREFTDHITVEMVDSSAWAPVPSFMMTSDEEAGQAEHGRGLIIVEALASAFGSSPNGRGKTVWAEVATG
ncbi:SpoIIE family protein phosphatase [Streptomyces sp. NBC_01190]|uniref:SpoIIE family protein phosphatase n=1 Tax=Streptomyces sp. NBC_01190 TaxID=2903767 RepID=UPI00386A1A25|nr:SpoIIE family protein phosphatase [Streptomyces sp. NBC_01190]